jgi:deazaflavin-dependent oxidoreductase (nitroreductase family)
VAGAPDPTPAPPATAGDRPGPATPAAATPSAAPPYQPAPPRGVLRWLLSLPDWLYRARLGRLLGHRFLRLTHRGRKSGQVRHVVLEAVHYDRATREIVAAAGWGERTQWLQNLRAGGALEVATGPDRYRPVVRYLPPEEAEQVFAGYEQRNRFAAPIVRRVLSGLLGWRYDGSAEARRRAVRQLTLVGFHPEA